MWLGFVGIAAYIPGVLLTGLCQLEGALFLVFLVVTVVPSKFSLWPEGEEQRGGHRAVRRSGMLKFPLAAGQEWCQSSLSLILSCRPSLLNVSGPAISLLLWFWEWKIGYYLPSKLVWLSGYILLKVENLVLIKRQPALPILWLTLISTLFQPVSLKL